MVKLLSPLAALLILSVSARAQVVAGAAAEAGAWVGPMAAAVTAAGSDRVAGLGYTSLTALSSPDAGGRLPFVSAPQALTPLTDAIQAQGLTPQTFAALPTAEKLAVLSRAAVPAEAHAAAVADEALASVAEPVRIGTYQNASHKTANAAGIALYLSPERAEQVAAAVASVKAYETKRSELIDAFIHDLPGKIAAGEFDGTNIIARDADGWHAADEAPEKRYQTLTELYRARLESLGRAAPGPWTIRQTEILKAALRQPDIAEALTKEYEESPETRSGTTKIAEFLDMHADRARAAYSENPKLKAALARFEMGAARGTDVLKVEKFYGSAIDRTRYASSDHAWLTGWIIGGGDAMPGWEEMKAIKAAAQKGYQRNAFRGMIGFFAGMAGMAAIGVSHWPNSAKLVAFAAMYLPMAYMFVNIWRRDSYNFEADTIDMHVNRLPRD
ncbi:MAG: hypothetical protein ACHQ51_05770 [Elusimicrobiota bacterium]